MKNLVITLLFALVMFGCITEKKRAKICATCALTNSVRDSVVTKDSVAKTPVAKTLTITLHDTIRYATQNPCADLCDSLGRLKASFTREIKSDKGTKLKVFVQGNELVFRDVIDSLKKVIHFQDTAITHYQTVSKFHSEIKQEPARCDKEHLTKLDSFFIITGRILWILFIGFLILKGIKYYRKFHLPH